MTRPTIVTDEVAKAIHIARYNGEREPDPMGDTDWEYCRRLARAAIAAMPAIVGGEVMAESIGSLTNSGRNCTFCGDAEHYGWCAAMRLYCEKASAEGRPVPNPIVRHG